MSARSRIACCREAARALTVVPHMVTCICVYDIAKQVGHNIFSRPRASLVPITRGSISDALRRHRLKLSGIACDIAGDSQWRYISRALMFSTSSAVVSGP